ncbi:hypothetical protein [Amantichitinum ursilacus]|uniref:Uncharacterized protein n=1 Tax=Amantichitinum ursilacus TaxID=857265 RepID=A0A0N0GLB6_9NEIS|nr:hypothetical protein [Amantichitinum ursilacus]KPC49675.1 hypothetical protein WG78_20170 [Amantichitinum ursilacus]
MAWSGGTELFEDVITAAQKGIPDNDLRRDFYLELIEAFEREGWDEQADCRGLDAAFDEALESLHPELTEDEDDDDDADDDVYH